MQRKIEVGIATYAGFLVAFASFVAAVVTGAVGTHLFGLSDTTLVKVAGIATGAVMLGRYAQAFAGYLSGGGAVPVEPFPVPSPREDQPAPADSAPLAAVPDQAPPTP